VKLAILHGFSWKLWKSVNIR